MKKTTRRPLGSFTLSTREIDMMDWKEKRLYLRTDLFPNIHMEE